MSPEYLNKMFLSFSDPDGATLILNAMAGAGTVQDHYIIILADC